MADQPAGGATPPKSGFFRSTLKMAVGGMLGLCTGAVAVYSNALFDRVVKPTKPVANFAVAGTDGLTVTVENHAAGDSGWWDFGDGTQLEAFDPAKPTVTHTYPAPGKYSIKLSVRNFLLEENDRAVGVELTTLPNALPPTVTGLKVEPIREQAPATYRITGELKNADEVVWRLGDKAEHAPAATGPFERYVTFEKPGQYPIVLTALSKTKKDPQVVVQSVSVSAPAQAVYEAVVSVTDAATRVEKTVRAERVSTPVRDRSGPTKGFDKVIHAGPGRVITAAHIETKQVPAGVVKNGRVDVAKDGKTARLVGEWGAGPDAVAKAAGGSDMTIPVVLTEEQTVALTPQRNRRSGVMDPAGVISVPLPDAPKGANVKRTIDVDFGLTPPTGQRTPLAKGTLDPSGKWSAPVSVNGRPFVVQATAANGAVRVVLAAGK